MTKKARKYSPLDNYEEYFQSPTIKFIVGPRNQEFFVHSQAIARLSLAFHLLAKCAFRQALNGEVNWDHVDPKTFTYFMQYAYAGTFNCIKPSPLSQEELAAELERCVPDNAPRLGTIGTIMLGAESALSTGKIKLQFITTDLFGTAHCQIKATCPEAPATQSFTEIFRTLVDLLLLAECYGVEALTDLVISKMHWYLSKYDFSSKRGPNDIQCLIDACYSEPAPQKLRTLVSFYLACNISWLWLQPSIWELVNSYFDLMQDLLGMLLDGPPTVP